MTTLKCGLQADLDISVTASTFSMLLFDVTLLQHKHAFAMLHTSLRVHSHWAG